MDTIERVNKFQTHCETFMCEGHVVDVTQIRLALFPDPTLALYGLGLWSLLFSYQPYMYFQAVSKEAPGTPFLSLRSHPSWPG